MSKQNVKKATNLKSDTIFNNSMHSLNYKMPEPNETYARIQSVRVKNLEQQVYLMHRELQRIRERMLPQEDLIRLNNILERLKELNLVLTDLRNHYKKMQQSTSLKKVEDGGNETETFSHRMYLAQQRRTNRNIINSPTHLQQNENLLNVNLPHISDSKYVKYYPRENAGYDRREISKTTDEQENNSRQTRLNEQDTQFEGHQELNEVRKESTEPFKTCEQLMEEIKPPGSILGKYLMRLQDFRTDPELRRKRWEKKQQEKLLQLEQRKKLRESSEMKGTSTEGIDQNNANNSSSTLQDSYELQNNVIKSRIDIASIRPTSETDSGLASDLPLINNSLSNVVFEMINGIERNSIALTIVLENDNVYHLSVSLISSGHSLGCFLATEEAIQEAKEQHLFRDLLTFFVVNAENSDSQKDRILGHSFEFIKIDVN